MQELQLKNNPVVDADSTTKQIKQLMSNASASVISSLPVFSNSFL